MTDKDGAEESEQPDTQPWYPDQGPDTEQMASDYLPRQDDWPAKTMLDLGDPAAVAALSQIGEMYPEVEELQPFVNETMQMFFRSQTSVGGASRAEYKQILGAMFGGNIDEETARNAFVDALAADKDDD